MTKAHHIMTKAHYITNKKHIMTTAYHITKKAHNDNSASHNDKNTQAPDVINFSCCKKNNSPTYITKNYPPIWTLLLCR